MKKTKQTKQRKGALLKLRDKNQTDDEFPKKFCSVAGTSTGMEQSRKRGAAIGRPRVVTDRAKVKELRAQGKSQGNYVAVRIAIGLRAVARASND